MRRIAILLALAAFAAPAGAQTIVGDLNNFDTLNDTGSTCYGFEIEIDGARSTDITYTFDWNHYGTPKIREDTTDPSLPKVFVRYESTKDAGGQWGANNSFTNVAIPTITPPQGHSCTDPAVNEGCEHFGVGYYGTPVGVKYHWLVDDNAGGLVYFGTPVSLATPKWTYTPPAGGVPAQAVAVIPAPVAPIAGREFGEPSWVKVIKTTTHSPQPVALSDLVSDDKDADGSPDWQNQEPSEVESEWYLLQDHAGGGARAAVAGTADDMGDGSETVTRRYEFYKYTGGLDTIDGETGEAMCSDVQLTNDPNDPLYRHGIGTNVGVTDANGDTQYVDCTAQLVVGDYVGAQMAGFAAAVPLGVIDHLQDGDSGQVYVPRTIVIGGVPPYHIDIPSGSLPPGLQLGDYAEPGGGTLPGVLWGTPSSGGDYPFTVGVTDANGTYASQTYSLHVTGIGVSQFDLTVNRIGSGTGTVSGSGINCGGTCIAHVDAGTSVTLSASPDPGNVFAGWTGACSGSGNCTFILDGASTVMATFTQQYQLSVMKAGQGAGTVSGTGINCTTNCAAMLDSGTAVTLTATAASGSRFSGWSGDCTGTGACTTTMNGPRSVVATFTPQFTLSISISGSGTVSGSGITCATNCTPQFDAGTPVTLTATPAAGYLFTGWSGDCAGTGACSVTMNAARSVTATFVLATQVFTMSVTVTGPGTVVSTPKGISCGKKCSVSFTVGTMVTLTATPSKKHAFVGWSGDCASAGASLTCTIPVLKPENVGATFN